MPVTAPVNQVRTLRHEDVAERRVAAVAGSGQHQVLALDAAREQHAVPVERQEGVVELVEGLEVVRVADADRRTVVPVAPRDVVAVLDPDDTRVIGVLELLLDFGDPPVGGDPLDGLDFDVPTDAIEASARVQVHLSRRVVNAEHARICTLERHYRRVEDAVGSGENVPLDDRIATRTPQRGRTAGGSVFPRDSGECGRIGDLGPEVHGGPFAMSSGDRHEARSRPRSGEPPVPRLAWTRVPQASAARMSAWRTPC